jgi:two-component system NtrC family sensor kinase
MKNSILFFSFLLFYISAFAQQKAIDSLKKLLHVTREDTSRVLLLNQLSRLYIYSKPGSALALAQQGEQIAKSIQYLRGEGNCLDDEGLVYNVTGNYPRALSTLLNSLRIGEKINDLFIIQKSLHDIAIIYSNEGDFRQSIIYIRRASTISAADGDARALGIVLLDLGDSYEKLNILDSALLYTRQSFRPFVKLKDSDLIGTALNNLGNIYTKLKMPDTAMNYYRRSIPYTTQMGDDDGICETTLGMAQLFRKLGQPDSSLYYARRSIAAGWHGGFTIRVLAASQFLSEYFEQRGQVDSAYHYQKISIVAKDSLYSQEKTKEIQNLNFAERQRQEEIMEKDAAYRANVRYYLLIAVIVFFVILAFVFYRNNKQNKIAKNQIQSTLNELNTTQNQLVQSAKMASLGELTAGIAHEIQNPLNFVNNFSDVNREMLAELKEELKDGNLTEALIIADDISANEEKINHHGRRAEFIVKGMLEHSRTSTGEKQETNINMLAEEFLKLSCHGLRAKDKSFNVEAITHFDEKLPKVRVAQQDIGRVLLNLFNNAFYAVNEKKKTAPADYKPEVIVSTSAGTNSLVISIRDNGNGIPGTIKDKIMQPFFTTKPAGEGTGLGLSLSYDIVVKGHGGNITVSSIEGEGAEFVITLPSN